MGFTAGYKVNEGTDYEFTVSDETISEVVLDTGIGESDIADYCYSALIDSRIETVKAESHTDVLQPTWAAWCQDYAMFYYINNTRYINSNVGINDTSDTVYERNLLIWYGTIYPGEAEEKTGWFLIMDIKDIKRFYVNFSNAGFGQTTVESTRTDSGVTTPFTGYSGDLYTYNSSLSNVYPNIYRDDDGLTTIRVINVLNINNEFWVGRLNPSNYGNGSTAYSTYGYSMWVDYKLTGWLSTSDTEHFFQKGTTNWAGIPKIIDMQYPDLGFDVSPVIKSYAESTDDMILDISAEHYGGFPVVTSAVPGCKTLNGILKWMSWCGLLFKYDGITYKPIIENGVIVGYSSNMFTPSEFDTMTNVTGNNISPTPPSPGPIPGDDDMESQTLGATGSSGGFTKFFVMSPSDLLSFLTDFYSRAEPGETLSGNLVCSYILGVPSTWATTDNISITIHNSAQGTPFVSSSSYKHVTATNNYIVAGNIEVPRLTNTFYDFSPYSTYELFIPCCGWITLPDTVAGRHIYVSIQIDIATCGAKGVVKFDDGATCAVCSGVLGSSIPMQVIESGLLRGANVQASSSALGGALMAGAGFGNGNVGLGLNGISNVVNAFTQSAIAGNTNYTNQKGSSGDITQFAMGHNCYLKITYPPIDEVVNNSMFGHTVGYLCEEVGSLSSFHGFTVCANPHVHINATSTERDEITQLLEQGVILP